MLTVEVGAEDDDDDDDDDEDNADCDEDDHDIGDDQATLLHSTRSACRPVARSRSASASCGGRSTPTIPGEQPCGWATRCCREWHDLQPSRTPAILFDDSLHHRGCSPRSIPAEELLQAAFPHPLLFESPNGDASSFSSRVPVPVAVDAPRLNELILICTRLFASLLYLSLCAQIVFHLALVLDSSCLALVSGGTAPLPAHRFERAVLPKEQHKLWACRGQASEGR